MEEIKDDKGMNTEMLLPLLVTLLSNPNNALEKEVAYLKGKVETLEKMMIGGNHE